LIYGYRRVLSRLLPPPYFHLSLYCTRLLNEQSGEKELEMTNELSEREFPPTTHDIVSDWQGCREDIHREFEKAQTFEQRGVLLAIYHAMMNIVEKNLIAPSDVETFKKARDQDYCLFIAKESTQGENVNSEILEQVTRREVQAGRMSPDHQLRKLALIGTTFGISPTAQLHEIEQQKAHGSWWQRATRWMRGGTA